MSITKKSSLPDLTAPSAVAWWLLTMAIMVLAMAVIGAITRLTESGLSITEWLPIAGAIPPMTEEAWEVALEKYRQIPEYQEVNKGMSLEAFKNIYWWEYIHRLWGRLLGLAFTVPMVWFWAKGKLPTALKPHVLVLFALGALQGYIGWWMVKSGLSGRVDVSQYRLAVHLGIAVVIFAHSFWLFMRIKFDETPAGPLESFRLTNKVIVWLIFLSIIMGAFVAGMNAGLAYNTWPRMDGQWVPAGLFVMSPWLVNFFENALTVQFIHRWVAQVAVVLIFVFGIWVLRSKPNKKLKIAVIHLLIMAFVQLSLGIKTLMFGVPIPLAALHQMGAFLLLACSLWTLYRLPRTMA